MMLSVVYAGVSQFQIVLLSVIAPKGHRNISMVEIQHNDKKYNDIPLNNTPQYDTLHIN